MPPKGAIKSAPVKRKADNNEDGRPRPASPKSLLWAHQLKQQHGYLLEKLNVLEDGISKLEKRASRSEREHDIGAIVEKVQQLGEGGESERARKEVTNKLQEVETRLEATIRQVAELTAADEQSAEAEKKAFENEQKLAKRVNDVEQSLEVYEEKLAKIGERINQDQVAEIKFTLENMVKQARQDDGTSRKIEEQLQMLEAATKELRAGQEQVAARMVKLENNPPHILLSPPNEVQTNATTKKKPGRKSQLGHTKSSDAAPSKVSHKTRSAKELSELLNSEVAKEDRGAREPIMQTNARQLNQPIVRSGRGWIEIVEPIEEMTNADARPASHVESTANIVERRRGRPAKAVPSIEEEPRIQRHEKGRPRRAPITKGDANDIARREQASLRSLNRHDAAEPAAGKQQAIATPPRAAAGSIRKQSGEDDVQTQLPTRTQATEAPKQGGRKRKTDTQDIMSPPPLRILRKRMAPEVAKKRPQLRRGQVKQELSTKPDVSRGKRRGLTNVYSSPISSSMSEDEIEEVTQVVFGGASNPFIGSKIDAVPPPRRRFINQEFNDEDLLRKMSAGALGS